MRTNKLLLYVCVLTFLLILLIGCKKEKVEHPLPKWFLKRSWSMNSLKLNGVEVPDTINKYFNEYKFHFYDYCDPLNRCYYGCNYYWNGAVYYEEYDLRPSLELFVGGIIEGFRFCFVYPSNYFTYPFPSMQSLKITTINKDEIHLKSITQSPDVYEVVFRSKVE